MINTCLKKENKRKGNKKMMSFILSDSFWTNLFNSLRMDSKVEVLGINEAKF